jgi:glutathione S-transferase
MRARMALLTARIHCELRNVDRLHLPTAVDRVPLLQLPNGKLLDDSFAIMQWASARRAELALWPAIRVRQQSIENLVRIVDGPFAEALQRYANAVGGNSAEILRARGEAEIVLAQLEARLARNGHLVGDQETLADLALLPFIYLFAELDRTWFDISPYRQLRAWLLHYNDNPAWQQVQRRPALWRADGMPVYLQTQAPSDGPGDQLVSA